MVTRLESSCTDSIEQFKTHHPKIEAYQNRQELEDKGLTKVYWNNIFIGIFEKIALVESSRSEMQIPPHQKESIKILTSKTEQELAQAFSSLLALDREPHPLEIDDKFSSIKLFIEQYTGNPRFKPQITKGDVDSLEDLIESLEKMNPPDSIRKRLTSYKMIISAFKTDKVLCQEPILHNTANNTRWYLGKTEGGLNSFKNLQNLLEKTEEGPIADQLEDLHRCGKIVKEEGMQLSDLRHGNLICFRAPPGSGYGDSLTFALVDTIEAQTKLVVIRDGKLMQPIVPVPGMSLTRLTAV